MNKKTLIVLSAFMAVSVMLAGCRLNTSGRGENDGYSRVLYSDTGEESSDDEEMIENRSKAPDSKNSSVKSEDKTDTDVDTDTNQTENVTQITQETTTYYITEHYDPDTDGGNMEIVGSSSDAESDTTADTATDTETENSADNDSVSDTESESDTQTESSSDTNSETVSDQTDSDTIKFTEADLDFVVNGERIKLGESMTDALKLLGEPLNISELPFGGKSYSFDGFTVNTKLIDDHKDETIISIEIFSDTIETEKLVKVGMTAEEACAVYGEDYLQYEEEYRYYIGNKYMYFYVQNGIVANIGYSFDNELE